MENFPDKTMDAEALGRLARSPAGQQLMAMLKGQDLSDAARKAAAGNYAEAAQALQALLADPKARELLQQLGRP